MKVAIILSGHLRCFEDCFESLKENILDHNSCDIFMHAYEDERVHKAIEMYEPNRFILEPEKIVSANHQHRCYNKNTPSMYKNIQTAFSLVEKNRYDCVVRTRYDLKYSKPIKFGDYDMSKCNIPSGGDWGGLCDIFAFSSYEIMEMYCDLFSHFDLYLRQIHCHPETLLRHHVNAKSIPINRMKYGIYIRRHQRWQARIEVNPSEYNYDDPFTDFE